MQYFKRSCGLLRNKGLGTSLALTINNSKGLKIMNIKELKERLDFINNFFEMGYHSLFDNELKIEREEIKRYFKSLNIEC